MNRYRAGRFRLDSDPFAGVGPHDFFFAPPPLTLLLDLIGERLTQGGQVLALVSEPGSGKSALLARLMGGADASWRIAHVQATPAMSGEALLDEIVRGFGVPASGGAAHPDSVESGAALRMHLDRLRVRAQIAVVVVDDAERLGADALRRLGGLVRDDDTGVVRVLLSGQAGLMETLRASGLDEGPEGAVRRLSLPALDETQVADYIHLRLHQAGLQGDSPFTPCVIRAIATSSRGRPGRVNELARQVLEEKLEAGRSGLFRVILRRVGRRTILAVLVGCAAATTALWERSAALPPSAKPTPSLPEKEPATSGGFESKIRPIRHARDHHRLHEGRAADPRLPVDAEPAGSRPSILPSPGRGSRDSASTIRSGDS